MKMFSLSKRDLAVLGGILLLVGIGWILLLFLQKKGNTVTVSVNGVQVQSFPMNQETTYDIVTSNGYNRLKIQNGKAYLVEADCPDGRCMKMGPIEREGESMICLPHRVVVEVIR